MRTRSVAISSAALLEMLVICCIVVFVVVGLPGLYKAASEDFNAAAAALNNQIMQMDVTANGKELWVQRGLSQVISVDLETRQVKSVFASDERPVGDWSVSRDGSTVLSAKNDRELLIYRNQEIVVEEVITSTAMLLTALSSDGSAAVRIVNGTSARCWDLSAPEPSSIDIELSDRIDKLGVDALGRFFAASINKGVLQLYDLKSGEKLRTIPTRCRLAPSPHFSDDGRSLALNLTKEVVVFSLSTFEESWSICTSEFGGFHSVAFSPNSRWIAVCGIYSGTHVYDTITGACQKGIPDARGVRRLCFSAASDNLYIGDTDGSLMQWSLADQKKRELISCSAVPQRSMAVRFLPNGAREPHSH